MEQCNLIQSNGEGQTNDSVQKFLDGAVYGSIYVNLGTCPSALQTELVKTFSEFRNRFIWSHEDIEFSLPANVMTCKSVQSRRILSHKNTTLFIADDDTVAIKQAFHYGVPMLVIPSHNNEQLHDMIKHSTLENISMMRREELNTTALVEKLKKVLNNKNLEKNAKQIANLLHHNSVDLSSDFMPFKADTQSQQISPAHLHLDALGALFFVIFVIVKVSLKFCQFYNNLGWKTIVKSKKTN